MRFITITLIVHAPDPATGAKPSTADRFREVIDGARLAEELGFDGFGDEVWPRPLQRPIRIWHGSATSRESVDLAARYGDPLFSANVTNPIGPYAELIRYYRERWAHYGHDPAGIAVGAGTAGYHAERNSQDAISAHRPVFAGYLALQKRMGIQPVFPTLEDFIERSSALIGSPAQVIEKVHRYHEQFGHSVLHPHADAGGLPPARHRASLELFQSDIAPVLRREIPDPPWGWGGGPLGDDAEPAQLTAGNAASNPAAASPVAATG